MYPRLRIDLTQIRDNALKVVEKCHENKISVTGVTKLFSAQPEIVSMLVEGGVDFLGDSRISNLKKLKHIEKEKWLLRIPMLSEVYDVVKYADVSLNSELEVIKMINEEAHMQNKIHKIILMADLGDLREGYFYIDEIEDCVCQILRMKNISFYGMGLNQNCYGGVIPETETMLKLSAWKRYIENKFNITIPVLSGGNSGVFYLIDKSEYIYDVNNLRLGEVILFGRETSYQEYMSYLNKDTFVLEAEIVELKNKPSVPIGKIGKDAFESENTYEDTGIGKRAIVAVGRQDVNPDALEPMDEKIKILGASSDHMILNVEQCDIEYKVGNVIEFRLMYSAALSAMTSPYVDKYYKY